MLSNQIAIWMLVIAGAVTVPNGAPTKGPALGDGHPTPQTRLALVPSTVEQRQLSRRTAKRDQEMTRVAMLAD